MGHCTSRIDGSCWWAVRYPTFYLEVFDHRERSVFTWPVENLGLHSGRRTTVRWVGGRPVQLEFGWCCKPNAEGTMNSLVQLKSDCSSLLPCPCIHPRAKKSAAAFVAECSPCSISKHCEGVKEGGCNVLNVLMDHKLYWLWNTFETHFCSASAGNFHARLIGKRWGKPTT